MGVIEPVSRAKNKNWPQPLRISKEEIPVLKKLIGMAELEEGIRFVSNVCGIDYDDITPDMPVEVFFEPMEGGYRIPLFRPVAD